MTALDPPSERPAEVGRGVPAAPALIRVAHGRWLGGVCAGLAPPRALKIGWVRLAFVAASLLGGLGIVAYCACWLILPLDAEPEAAAPARGGLVAIAQTCAAALGLGALALLAAGATVFGFGWIVLALAAATLAGLLVLWPRRNPAWALLPVAALTLPSLAVASAGVRLAPRAGASIVAPGSFTGGSYASGLDTLMVDLRRAQLPASGTVTMRIDAGVRRTIVALPHDRCVHVVVDAHVTPYLGRLAAVLSGRSGRPFSALVVFGVAQMGGRMTASNASAPGAGPTLRIEFRSQGGSLYVRDYPTSVQPGIIPDWPGWPVAVEPRPDTHGMNRREAKLVLSSWRARRTREQMQERDVSALTPGPCGVAR